MRTIWQAILDRVAQAREDLARLLRPRSPTDTVGFSIAFIALAAKLAKSDGEVTRDEVAMFRRIFLIPPGEERNAARVYNLCRQETTGFRDYARRLRGIVGRHPQAEAILADVLDGLFHVAMADGAFHPEEEAFLREVHAVFGLPEREWAANLARHVPDHWDPWAVLGLEPGTEPRRIRLAWRRLVRENHPDRLVARGLPPDMVQLANARLADINRAYAALAGPRAA